MLKLVIMIPLINNGDDAKSCDSVKYPPVGKRGAFQEECEWGLQKWQSILEKIMMSIYIYK